MKLNWNFLGREGVQNEKPSVGGVFIYSGTTHSTKGRLAVHSFGSVIMLDNLVLNVVSIQSYAPSGADSIKVLCL